MYLVRTHTEAAYFIYNNSDKQKHVFTITNIIQCLSLES